MKKEIVNKKINLLDCTLRDGGYYNNWDFSLDLVNDYLKSMSKIGIKYVELGFRSFQSKNFRGSNWYTSDEYIQSLKIPKNLKVSVMVNASQIISQNNIKSAIKKIFKYKNKTKIDLIRVACHFHEINQTIEIVKILKNFGYKVAINLMQISEQKDSKITETVKKINNTGVEVLYFADSLGSMDSYKIKKLINFIGVHWKGPIGVHTHDNLGKAVSNNVEAFKSGATWIDSTVTGMGRGAGNGQTEYFLIEIYKLINKKVNLLPLLNLIKKYFIELKNKYNWGSNTFYYLAGIHGIHPTYIQEMISTHFSDAEILAAIDILKNSEGSKYNVDLVRSEFQKNIKIKKGNWIPQARIKSKEILLIASGPSIRENKRLLENYIVKRKPFVIALNTDTFINKKLIDVYAACNPLKLNADSDLYKKIKKPIIMPKSLLSAELTKKFKKLKILDFGVGLKQNTYQFFKTGAIVPRLYNIVYALAIATSGKANKILLAGFDGYGTDDVRTKIVNDLIFLYSSSKGSKPLLAITPTTYSISSKSVYSLK